MLSIQRNINKLAKAQKLRVTKINNFSSLAPPAQKYILKRPWHFNDEDYIDLMNQVHFIWGADDIIQLVEERRYDLNEVHVARVLEEMFNKYMAFDDGNHLHFKLYYNKLEICMKMKPLMLDVINACDHGSSYGFGGILLGIGISIIYMKMYFSHY